MALKPFQVSGPSNIINARSSFLGHASYIKCKISIIFQVFNPSMMLISLSPLLPDLLWAIHRLHFSVSYSFSAWTSTSLSAFFSSAVFQSVRLHNDKLTARAEICSLKTKCSFQIIVGSRWIFLDSIHECDTNLMLHYACTVRANVFQNM